MQPPALKSLIALARIQANLNRLLAEEQRLEAMVAAAREEQRALELRLFSARAVASKRSAALEEERLSISSQLQALEMRRRANEKVTNTKLRQGALREIQSQEQALKQRLSSLPQESRGAVEDSSTTTALETELATLTRKREEVESDARAHAASIEERRARYHLEVSEYRATLDSKTLAHFDRLVEREPTPIAEIVNHSCNVCFMRVAPQELLNLQNRGELIRCRGCARFLSLPEESSGTE